MARATIPLNFNAFLEKAKLKDDRSNYTDWVSNLSIILIAALKNYVLDALLGDTYCRSTCRRYERLTMLGMMTT